MGRQFFVVLFVYPETKGVSLEHMQKKLGIAWADDSRRFSACKYGPGEGKGNRLPLFDLL